MLDIKLINSQATLNYYFYISSVQYSTSESVTINFQLFDVDSGVRFIPSSSATCNVTFKQNDGTMLTVAASFLFNPSDLSMWKVSLTAMQVANIVGSNFQVTLDVLGDGTNIQQALGVNLLSPIYFDGDC